MLPIPTLNSLPGIIVAAIIIVVVWLPLQQTGIILHMAPIQWHQGGSGPMQ